MTHPGSQNLGWIADKIKLTHWDYNQIYEQFSLITIHSILVDDNPKFQELKYMIEEHNKQVRQYKLNHIPINHAALKYKFIATLFNMLTQITFMKNSENQLKYLNDVYKWANQYEFTKKNRPATASTRNTTRPITAITRPISGTSVIPSLTASKTRGKYDRNTQRQIIPYNENSKTEKNEFFETIDDLKYNSKAFGDKVSRKSAQIQNFDYANGNRTKHVQYEAAHQRLKDYKRKNIDLEIEQVVPKQVKKNNRIKYEQKKIVKLQQPELQTINIDEAKLNNQGMPQGLQNQQMVVAELQIGDDDKDEEPEIAEPEEVPDKLRPTIMPYAQNNQLFDHINLEMADKRQILNQNKVDKQQKEAKQMVKIGRDWAAAKSRWQQQQNRKRQSAKIVLKTKPINKNTGLQNFEGIKNFINPANILQIGKKHSKPQQQVFQHTIESHNQKQVLHAHTKDINYLHSKQFQKPPPLQKFDRTRCLSAHHNAYQRPKLFSQILQQARKKVESQYDNELIQIKERLAKHKVVIDMPKLKQGIQTNDLSSQQEQSQQFNNITGQQLLHNPFFKVGKKKKKKKKKKK